MWYLKTVFCRAPPRYNGLSIISADTILKNCRSWLCLSFWGTLLQWENSLQFCSAIKVVRSIVLRDDDFSEAISFSSAVRVLERMYLEIYWKLSKRCCCLEIPVQMSYKHFKLNMKWKVDDVLYFSVAVASSGRLTEQLPCLRKWNDQSKRENPRA